MSMIDSLGDAGARAEAIRSQEALDATYGFRNQLLAQNAAGAAADSANVVLDKWGRAPGDPDYGKDPLSGRNMGGGGQRVASDAETATSILANTLKYYGLDDTALIGDIKTALAERRITGSSSIDDIGVQLRESQAFQRRFAANERRRAEGKPAYSVSQYLQLESSYRNVLRAAGMPKDFYDTTEDFQNFIAQDISPDEIQYRVQQGYQAVREADPAVVSELKSLYGLDDNTLAAYFVDPNRARETVVRAARAAEVATQARKQAGIGLTAGQAESLVMGGVSESAAQQGFAQVRESQQLLRPLVGEQQLTEQELIEGTFQTSGPAAQRVAQTRRRRKALVEGGGTVALGTVGQ